MKSICNIPFTEIKCGDILSPCCSAWLNTEKFNVDMLKTNLSAVDIWKNNYSEFRASILDGSYKYCSDTCPNKIAVFNNVSPTLQASHPDIYNKIIIDPDSSYPINVTLTYDPTCNLKCKSCRSSIIKSDSTNISKLFNAYLPLLKECTEITISGDGDAFASHHYFSLLQSDLTEFAPKLDRILLQTNGLLFTQENYEKIHPTNRKLIKLISISIDAASEKVYKETRGGNFSTLCKNLEFVKHLKETTSEWLFIYSGFTISKNNISDAVNFIDFISNYKFNMVQYWLVRDWARGDAFDKLSIDTNSQEYKDVKEKIHQKIDSMKELMEIKWMISDKNVESSIKTVNTRPQQLQQKQYMRPIHIQTNPIINHDFSDDAANCIIKYQQTNLNNNTPTKRYAIYCPFYISDQNLGHWINNWIANVASYEDADKYYTLSYPENFDASKYEEIIQKLNSVATCIKSDFKIYHTHALEIAHEYLKTQNYDYMLHIEQDVILNAPIGNHLINKLNEDGNDVLITDIRGVEIFDGESDIDISVFAINLHNYDSSSYHTYVSSDNIKTFELLDHTLYNIGEYKKIPPVLEPYSNYEIYNSINALLNLVYNKTDLIHWVHNYMSIIKVDNAINPVFVDSARGYPIHAYMNNKLSIAYGISSYAKHLKQSRESYIVSRIDINTIINRFGYQPIGEDSPNKHINIDTYFSKGLDIVIISKNQKQSIKKMLDVLKFDIPTANRIFVLDRCTDGSKELLESHNEFFVERHDAEGFCAGSARNLGLKYTNPEHDVLFLDGDRIPNNLNYERITQMLYYFNISMIKNKNDTRSWFVNVPSINTQYDKYNNNVWSSAILLRRTAINKISNIVGNGNIFDPIFDGNWGCEDEYLGDVAYSLGMISGGFPSHIYVEGTTTASNNTSDEYRNQVEKRNKLRGNLFIQPELLIGNQPYLNKDERRELVNSIVSERRNVMRNMIKHRDRE